MAFKIGENNFLPALLDLSTKEMVDGSLTQANLVDATLVYDYAFYNQKNLVEMYAHNAESIGYRSFYGCTALTHVGMIGCKTIGASAFEGCTKLNQVRIGKDLTFIGKDAFKNCNVYSVYFDGNIEDWAKITFSNEYSNPVMCVKNSTKLYVKDEFGNYVKVKNIVIPSSVSSISRYTYNNLIDVESITILGNTTIPSGAFGKPEYLRRFTTAGDNGLNLLADYFNENTSQYTYATQDNYLPVSLRYFTYTGDSIKTRFCYGTDLGYITFNGTTINASAFEGCYNLREITLSSRLTSIKSDAFKNCSLLTSVKYTGDIYITPDSSGWSGISFENDYANPLYANDNVSLYLYNESSDTWYQPTEYYDSHNTVNNITLPNYAFYNFKQITKVDLTAGKVVALGEHSFDGCTSLTTINFGTTIKEIPAYAFARTGITTLTVPNTFEDIRGYAFANCPLVELVIPDDYLDYPNHRIWQYAFGGSTPNKLTTPDLDVLISFNKVSSTSYSYNGDKLKTLFFSTSSSDTKIKEIYITNPGYASKNEYGTGTLLDDVVFSGLKGLNKLSIPSYKYIERMSFYNCNALTELTYRGTKSAFNYAVTSTSYIGAPSAWNTGSAISVVHCTDGDITV